jgi:hypothetical protein
MAQTETAQMMFESRARDMLSRHPAIPHEWRRVKSRWTGDRLDLVCNPGAPNEVFATISEVRITVGDRDGHRDFEDFGRGLSESSLAQEAFEYLLALLRSHGHPEAAA